MQTVMTRVTIHDPRPVAPGVVVYDTNGSHADAIVAYDPFHAEFNMLIAIEVDVATINAARAVAGLRAL